MKNKKEIIEEKINNISLIWYDSINEKKKFNKKLHFIEDAYYHFFSIIRIFLNNKNLVNNFSRVKRINLQHIIIIQNLVSASKNKKIQKDIILKIIKII